jgi:glutamyl/glutaminyl-tRNA synthetase
MGYLPEALVNYLALLGWGAEDGKTETFTLPELTRAFSLERVTPSPAIFDFEKLNWLNRYYFKQADKERVAKLAEEQFCRHASRHLSSLAVYAVLRPGNTGSAGHVKIFPSLSTHNLMR